MDTRPSQIPARLSAQLSAQQKLERLSSLLRSESRSQLSAFGLLPVQFEALHYLSICNRYSDTPKAVTEYLGQTKGSVSQTLKVLEKKNLLEKSLDRLDKRVTHLSITEAGMQLIDKILPSPLLTEASTRLKDEDISQIDAMLGNLLTTIQQANKYRSFGQCSSCRHNIKHTDKTFQCGLTGEPLDKQELTLICREHEND